MIVDDSLQQGIIVQLDLYSRSELSGASGGHRIHVVSTMFRLLKEALAAPPQPTQSQARRESASTGATPDPPGKRISISAPSETTAGGDESVREVKKDAKKEDWEVKRTLGAIRELTQQQRSDRDVDFAQIEKVMTLFRRLRYIPADFFCY